MFRSPIANWLKRKIKHQISDQWRHHCTVTDTLVEVPVYDACPHCRQREVTAQCRTNEDRLAEALRRQKHGEARPVWVQLSDQDKQLWYGKADEFLRFLARHGLSICRNH